MFEFHGCATIRFTAENRDREDEDQLQAAAIEAVQSYVRQLGYGPVSYQPFEPQGRVNAYSGALVSADKTNVVLDIRVVNGEAQLWAAGAKNHAAPIMQELLDLFHYIARVAPGPYGLLYILDDEDPVRYNDFQVYCVGAQDAHGTRGPVPLTIRSCCRRPAERLKRYTGHHIRQRLHQE